MNAIRSLVGALVGLSLLVWAAPTLAQQQLNPVVARDLLAAYELIEADKHAEALSELNRLIARRSDVMTPFDRASVLQIRGSAYVNLEDYDGAIRDFGEALRLEALPEDQQGRLRFNLAQLYFVTERYAESIQFFNDWLAADGTASATTYFMLAAAHYHLENYAEAVTPIRRAIEMTDPPERRYFDLLNVLLNELNRRQERTQLMQQMVSIWPDDLSYWRQLSSLYMEQDMQRESFSVLESAYLAGLITSENDLILLAQFYSTFNNPHRGAELVEREMEAGRVERTVTNLELLSQLWSQAREHRKAIPVLRQAAQLSDTGMLSFRLGQAFLADEQNDAAAQAFRAAIDKGELDTAVQAEAWLLLGNALFNQAGPGDRAQRRQAYEAFGQAERFNATRRQAADWRRYIRAIDDTETRQAMLEQEQSERLEVAAQERLLTACRAQQLAGQTLTQECIDMLEAAAEDF